MGTLGSEEAKNVLEHVRHLRQISFWLLAFTASMLILLAATKEPWAHKAVKELSEIRSFIQSQESTPYGRFGSLWLKRRLQSNYGKKETGPEQGFVRSSSGQELDCFAFYHLGFQGSLLSHRSLDTTNAELAERVFSESVPVKTVSQWRALWDGMYGSGGHVFWVEEIMLDRAEILLVNHRPEYKRSALGIVGFDSLLEVVRGAKPREDLAWVSGPCKGKVAIIKPDFIFLRPSANHVREQYTHAFWLLLFAEPDSREPRFYEGTPWNHDGFYFLHIPVRVRKLNLDLQELITKEAGADWRSGPYTLSFPGLEQTLREAIDFPFEQAEIILRSISDLESRSSRSVKFGGFELSGASVFTGTLLVLFATQFYFLIHLRYFQRHHSTKEFDFPWIALYSSLDAKITFILTTCLSPAVPGLVVGYQFGAAFIWIIASLSVILSVVTTLVFLKLCSIREAPSS